MITLKVTYTDGRDRKDLDFEDASDAYDMMLHLMTIEKTVTGTLDNMTVIVSTDTIHGITHMNAQIQES